MTHNRVCGWERGAEFRLTAALLAGHDGFTGHGTGIVLDNGCEKLKDIDTNK